MKRSFTILLLACLSCCSPKLSVASASQPSKLPAASTPGDSPATTKPGKAPPKKRKCGPTGLFRVLEVKKIKVILLQRGCYIQQNGKTVGYEPQDYEILVPNEDQRYMLSFSQGAYFNFRKGRPHLIYFYAGGRRVIRLPNLEGEENIFNYSMVLKALSRGHTDGM